MIPKASVARRIDALAVRGPYRGASGHDHHVREFVRHLARHGVRLHLADIPEWGPVKMPDDATDPWFDTLSEPVEAGIALHFCMPHQVVSAPGSLVVNYTMFEASRIPPPWVERGLGHARVVVPTESSRQAWLAGGVPAERVRLCPLGVDTARFRPDAPPLDLVDRRGRAVRDYRTRVLNVSEVTSRKNLLTLLRIWIEATSAGDDAILVMKLGRSRAGATVALMRDLDAAERAMGKSRRDAAPILFLDRVLAEGEMPGLFAAASHYWSMSRGEGWDLPMVEAAATGLRLIAPRHSAYTAYLDDSVATMLPARPVPALVEGDAATQRLFEGSLWWEPDEDAAVAAIRRALEGTDDPLASPRARVVPALSWTASASRLLEILEEVAGCVTLRTS